MFSLNAEYFDIYFEYTQRYKKRQSKISKTLYSKTIIDKLDLPMKTVLI